jgi:hypothetical protein
MIEVDGRNRVTLPGKAHRRYLLHEQPDGTVILVPAVVMSELEATYLANPDLQARIEYARAHPEDARPRPPRRTT